MTKKHSTYAPSSSHRWFKCPGSILLTQQAKKAGAAGTGSNPAAEEGTRQHDDAERRLQEAYYDINSASVGVRYYLRHIYQEKKKTPPMAEFYEFQVRSQSHPEVYGTLDYAMLSKHRLVIMDYKNGSGVLYHPGGTQLKVYAYMFLEMLEGTFPLPPALELHIIQPNYEGEEPARIKCYDTAQFLREFGEEFDEAMEEIDKHPEYTRLGDWCQFCKGSSLCPSQADRFRDLFEMAESDEGVENLDLSSFLEVLEKAQSVSKLIAETRERAKEMLESGKTLDGWNLQVYSNGSKRLRRAATTAEYSAMFDEEE